MSYYELPEHCTECEIEIYPGGFSDTGLCLSCWKQVEKEYDAAQSERA